MEGRGYVGGKKGHQRKGRSWDFVIMVQQAGYDVTYSSRSLCCFLTMCTKGHSVFIMDVSVEKQGCVCTCEVVQVCSEISRLLFPSVCGVDESPPRWAGRTGCHGLQVCTHWGKETVLLPGGPTVLCYQTAHKLPLQGDLFTFTYSRSVTFQRSCVEILRLRCLYWFVSLFKLNNKSVLLLSSNPMKRLKSTINLSY